ncbi:MAG TPA: sugar ABC transporter permease, partial [Nonomuraea sp.]|nr:sugar ABC transporter permease [Nonomuraea sp.]
MTDAAETSPAVRGSARPKSTARKEPRIGFEGMMMTPGLLLLAALSIVPFLALIAMSFSRVRLLGGVRLDLVGLTNWARFFTDADMWMSWLRTVIV